MSRRSPPAGAPAWLAAFEQDLPMRLPPAYRSLLLRYRFPAFEVGSQRLDELAKWIVGEPNTFLNGGQEMRRVEF